jgi:hypothetical protein
MVELPAAGEGFAQRGRIAQIAFDPLDSQPLNILEVGSGASQDADVDAAVDQRARHCAADESGSPSNESFHLEDVKGET